MPKNAGLKDIPTALSPGNNGLKPASDYKTPAGNAPEPASGSVDWRSASQGEEGQ